MARAFPNMLSNVSPDQVIERGPGTVERINTLVYIFPVYCAGFSLFGSQHRAGLEKIAQIVPDNIIVGDR